MDFKIVKLPIFWWSIIASFCINSEPHRELVILHTNDMHARVLGVDASDAMCTLANWQTTSCFGGFDRLDTKVRAERALNKNVLVLDAGDQFQGTMFHFLYRGLVSASFMNRIGYHAMAAGNHEFDDGPRVLADFINELKFPLLSANIDVTQSPELKNKIKPYVVINQNGLRIGILGYTTEDTSYLSNPGPLVKFLPVIESVKKAVAALKRAKVDVIVAISHAGLNQDINVAKNVDGIAAIVSGHSNSLLSNKIKNADGPCPLVIKSPLNKPVLLVSAYAYGRYLGKLKFTFDKNGVPDTFSGEPILLDHTIARNPQMRDELMKLYQPIAAMEQDLVGRIPVDIDGHICRFDECLFGNLIADAMLDFTRQFGVEMALMNGGGIRTSLPKGPVTQAQLKDALPFDKTLVLLKLTGKKIREILEHGVAFSEDKKNDNTGRFLQVSGLRYSFDPKNPKGKRVRDIFVVNALSKKVEVLDENRIYSIVTNNYLVSGGDNFTHFQTSSERWSIAIELKELLASFLKKSLSQLPSREGRIINLSKQSLMVRTK